MNIKDLLKNLSCLTLHAILVAVFGAILMVIATASEYAAGRFCLPTGVAIKAIVFVLEVPFLLAVLSMAVAESKQPLKDLASTVKPAVSLARRRSAKRRIARRKDV